MQECREQSDTIITWRRHLHTHPELSFQEHQTSAYIKSVLEGFGCGALSITQPRPTAVVAELRGGRGGGSIIALRADIDALPLQEEADVPFPSSVPNVMHACGHDTHAAMLLGAAKVLCTHAAELQGSVRFLFQHAEEFPPGGAVELVQDGVLADVHRVFGIHVMPQISCGVLSTMPGTVMAGGDNFSIIIHGRGGHASMPHVLVDPVPVAAEVVMALQTIVSRRINPQVAPVISITTMTTGPNESHNVIPDSVKLLGTARSFAPEVRSKLPGIIQEVASGVVAAHGASCTVEIIPGYACTVNDPVATREVLSVAKMALGPEHVEVLQQPFNGGEDFSAYASVAPACFAFLGVASSSPQAKSTPSPSLHSTLFRVNEDALIAGTQVHVAFVHYHLQQKNSQA